MISLTDEQKREIGQHFVFGFHGHVVSEDIKTLIRDYHLGNIILMKRNVQSIAKVHALVQELQAFAKACGHDKPLMIGIDQENGLVSAFSSTATYDAGTQFPGAMALAATGSPDLAEQVSSASAREMKMAGINWAYSPVADVNSDPRNPVIGVRSFGDDPEKVGLFATAVARGLTSAGVAPSPKHFPGHGDTHVDSHLALPVIRHSLATLLITALPPFQALISTFPSATIMTGHMALPLVTGDEVPCSLSRKITTDLLRTQMGYEGVVVTDCLEMDAVVNGYGSEGGAVLALQAGADVVMICHTFERQRGAIEATWKAVQDGGWTAADINASAQRVRALKEEFAGSWEEVLSRMLDEAELQKLKAVNAELSRKAYAASVAVVRGPVSGIISGVKTVLVLTPEMQSLNKAVDDADGVLRTGEGGTVRNTAGPSYLALAALIARRTLSSQHIVYSSKALDKEELRGADVILFVTRNADQSPWQLEHLETLLEAKKKAGSEEIKADIVVLQSCGPYDLLKLRGALTVPSLACFEFTPPAFEAAVNVLLGDKEATGIVPVLGGLVTGL
ncbi:glycoside hydrolase family 3 protein [Athelia psychrophila]|uniref:Glycoside hydrolase family 3 protein n=1 Tax=Athelia psychrophila TaxID=1759441 RepID=A0A166T303_9AGAM|nr:glycoside hydrolase family 3 protein [Fibularhizoctonia sp. CBS 109695]